MKRLFEYPWMIYWRFSRALFFCGFRYEQKCCVGSEPFIFLQGYSLNRCNRVFCILRTSGRASLWILESELTVGEFNRVRWLSFDPVAARVSMLTANSCTVNSVQISYSWSLTSATNYALISGPIGPWLHLQLSNYIKYQSNSSREPDRF